MEVEIKQVEGLTFVARGGTNHWVIVDGPKEFYGSEAGARPMELMLISLGSCTASDVAAILMKKRVKLNSFEVKVTGERSNEHPKVFTKIHITYFFYGKKLEDKDLERAIKLSQEKYCPVTAMLKKAVDITYSYQVVDSS